jgi:hypothetical protein
MEKQEEGNVSLHYSTLRSGRISFHKRSERRSCSTKVGEAHFAN